MEQKHVIIILVAVIVVLAAILGVMFLQSNYAKEPCKIKVTSDKEQYEGGELSILLTDLNKTPIKNEIVNVTIKNKKGKLVFDNVVKTDKKGKAKLDLDLKKGEYKVVVSYGGNENYSANNTTQKLTIKEEVVSTSYSTSQNAEREEYKITSDGWNPREHEVSRVSMGNGYERVYYDDHYVRVVDQYGNIVSYGYGG